jgi:hypothetical protein
MIRLKKGRKERRKEEREERGGYTRGSETETEKELYDTHVLLVFFFGMALGRYWEGRREVKKCVCVCVFFEQRERDI